MPHSHLPHRIIKAKGASIFSFMLFVLTLTMLTNITSAAQPAPVISVESLDGQTVNLANHRDEIIYVDFWATWCPPCRKSFPWMEKMHQKYAPLGLKIIAISLDGKREPIDQFLKSSPVTFTIAHDPRGKSAEAFKVTGMPSSYIIDRQGNLHYSHIGFRSSDKDKLEKKLKHLLAQ